MVWKNYVLRSTFHKNRNQFADDWVRRSSTNQAAHLMMKGIVRAATMRTRRMAGLGGLGEWLCLVTTMTECMASICAAPSHE